MSLMNGKNEGGIRVGMFWRNFFGVMCWLWVLNCVWSGFLRFKLVYSFLSRNWSELRHLDPTNPKIVASKGIKCVIMVNTSPRTPWTPIKHLKTIYIIKKVKIKYSKNQFSIVIITWQPCKLENMSDRVKKAKALQFF